jgi:hypothetical protein
MKCCVCEENIHLTWNLYFRSLLGRLSCPDCGVVHRLKRGGRNYWLSIAVLYAGLAFVFSPFMIGVYLYLDLVIFDCGCTPGWLEPGYVILGGVVSGAIVSVVQKRLLTNWGQLIPLATS